MNTYVPINNSCERGLRAELRANLLGREINGGRRPVTPEARIKLTGEQASWLNTVCDHTWPEYGDVVWETARPTTNTLYPYKARPSFAHVEACAYKHTYPVRLLQELLNRLDEQRDARDAAEFDADCIRSGIRNPGALNTPLGRAIVRDIQGAAGHETLADAHRYGDLAEDTVPELVPACGDCPHGYETEGVRCVCDKE